MYINFFIFFVFFVYYVQFRRIVCDVWNKMKDIEYILNVFLYGWWQDKVYQFNDFDYIVLCDVIDGENRVCVILGVIIGIFIVGDDFSKGGFKEVKEKVMKYLMNVEINVIVNGEFFYFVDGNGEKLENQFVCMDKDGKVYYVVFNYMD